MYEGGAEGSEVPYETAEEPPVGPATTIDELELVYGEPYPVELDSPRELVFVLLCHTARHLPLRARINSLRHRLCSSNAQQHKRLDQRKSPHDVPTLLSPLKGRATTKKGTKGR